MKKVYLTWSDIICQTQDILCQIHRDGWRPDYVVGITRGGVTPANLISQYLDVPMQTLKVSLRHGEDCESNCWMAEDAFGYIYQDRAGLEDAGKEERPFDRGMVRKRILIVDDINDSGATFNWIRQDWQGSCLPNNPAWSEVWGENVRVAVLVDNQSSASELPISYSAIEVNKLEDPQWIVFPWEDWWQR